MKIFNNLISLNKKSYGLLGLTDESFCVYINQLFQENNESIIVLCNSLLEANNLLNSITSYSNDVLFFPMDDFLTSMAISASPELMVTRLETLNEILRGQKKIIITHLNAFLRFLPTKKLYQESVIKLKVGLEIDVQKLGLSLINIGYKRDSLVYKTLDVAIRGYVIDVFPSGEEHPVRIEFFGDEIESIRVFDEGSQLSLAELSEIAIYPATDILIENSEDRTYLNCEMPLCNQEVYNIADYLSNYTLVIKDYNQLKNHYLDLMEQVNDYKKEKDWQQDLLFPFNKINLKNAIYYLSKDNLLVDVNYEEVKFNIKEVPKFKENIDAIIEYLRSNYMNTIILCLKKYQIKNFVKYLDIPFVITDINNIYDKRLNIVELDINEGFIYEDFLIITDKELFNINKTKKAYKTKFKYATNIKSLNKLEVGDAIVHSIHGIGLYNGIKTLDVSGLKKDYIELLYKGNDKLYIPVEKINTISKFTGKEGVMPKINGLGSTEWQKTKKRVTDKVKNVAQELLKIYAERELRQGFKFSPDTSLQIMFEEEFPYIPTTDQALAVKQIKEEMETSHPMDRLLCGDVGFGKTEVAFRAIFKAICDSKQVLYLCPTTILSMQIYNNAKERFKNFPVNIALLNRFTSAKDTNKIIKDLQEGKIDFLIGTHKLLNNEIKPKDLGLLVIDEEQRFGVTHKEKIKKYKANVDVLTLTATPIPRTLQMSLVGIRSLSLITTPPVNRYPIQTYVVEENELLIKEAIYKELSRNGQVFVLHNRVDTIQNKVYEIKRMVPEARIIYVHGKMDKLIIEREMLKFINHEADILVCTTIIETGIDIPNVNTLIIYNADCFGLSQLYQIRGRVGRSDKIAYSYMLYRKGHILNETATKRLKTIQDFTELGSGFKIASRDLSIRGAGDILGSEQSGFIDTVGIDLYLKILNEEVARLKGEVVLEDEPEKALINVSTHVDSKYAEEAELKIEIHKMINSINSYDKLIDVKNELEDRFGKIDQELEIYMYQEWFDKMANELDVIKVLQTKTFVEITFSAIKSRNLNYEEIFVKSFKVSKYFKFSYKNECLVITLELPKLEKHYVFYLIDLLKIIKEDS